MTAAGRPCCAASTIRRWRRGCTRTWPRICAGGAAPNSLLITEGQYRGQRLAEVARRSGRTRSRPRSRSSAGGDPAVASFNQSEADIAAFMARPWVMTGSDASEGHPRVFGSFARKYAEYVRRLHVLTPARVHRAQHARSPPTPSTSPAAAICGPAPLPMSWCSIPAPMPRARPMRQPTLLAAGVRTGARQRRAGGRSTAR